MDTIDFAKAIRKNSLKMVHQANASHIGGILSMSDILAILYSKILKIDPHNPNWIERDRFLLSKGHACAGLYSCLGLLGYFPLDELTSYGQNGSKFLTHTSHKIPGVEISSGSLGHALPMGSGLSLAAKRKNSDWRVFVLLSDGELDEGSNWESILFAPQHKLDNLILIVDYNKIQSLGTVKEVIDLDPLKNKFVAFNWECFEVDGHDHGQLLETFNQLKPNGKPKVIIAHTIKGKGVDYMENKLAWHYKSPSEQEYNNAIEQINTGRK